MFEAAKKLFLKPYNNVSSSMQSIKTSTFHHVIKTVATCFKLESTEHAESIYIYIYEVLKAKQ